MEGTEWTCPSCGQVVLIPPGDDPSDFECPACGTPIAEPQSDADPPPEPREPAQAPPGEAIEPPAMAAETPDDAAETGEPSAADSLRQQMREQAAKQSSAMRRLVWFVISLVVFVVILGPANIVTTVFALVPVILVHELGHLLAMKLCGYTDVTVFFIPLFGAGAAGREARASQTKRAFVSLMGPLPGIVLGFVLMLTVRWASHPVLASAVQLLFIVNVFNLLPVQPLDGGRLLQAVVMSRSAFTAIVFALASPVLLGLVGLGLGDWVLVGLGVFMFLSAMTEVKVILAASKLRKAGHTLDSARFEDLPDAKIELLLGEIRARFPKLQDSVVPNVVRRLYDRLRVPRSPLIATLGFLGVFLFAVLAGVVGFFISYEVRNRADLPYKGKRISEWVAQLHGADEAARDQAHSVLMDAIAEDEANIREATVYTIGELGPKGKAAVPILVAALKQSDGLLHWRGAQALGKIGPDAAPAVPALREAIGSDDWFVREHAARALGRIGPASAPAVADLAKALGDEQPLVRQAAAEALATIGPVAAEALPALEAALETEDGPLARMALRHSIRAIKAGPEPKEPGTKTKASKPKPTGD